MSVCLVLLTRHWPRIFRQMFGPEHRGWTYELIGVRNENKHLVGRDHPSDYAWRALDTMFRLCESIDIEIALEIQTLRSSVDLCAYGQVVGTPANVTTGVAVVLPTEGTGRRPDSAMAVGATELARDLETIGPDFSGAYLRKMNFAGANLSGADFTDANLTDANLKGAVLSGATFKNTQLGNADLTDTDLTHAAFEATTLSVRRDEGGSSVIMVTRGANFTGAKLDGATLNFKGADLQKVTFAGANLSGADFTDANLEGANLRGATLRGVNLKGAHIKDADTNGVHWT